MPAFKGGSDNGMRRYGQRMQASQDQGGGQVRDPEPPKGRGSCLQPTENSFGPPQTVRMTSPTTNPKAHSLAS